MAIFNRRKPEEDAAMEPTPSPAAPARDADFGVPPFRPAAKEPNVPVPPKPMPAQAAALAARSGAPLGLPNRPAVAAPTADPADRRTLVVGRGISLQGSVSDAERLVVEGLVESEMLHAAELVIATGGVFRGEVQVDDAEIGGLFDGTITARGSLTIRATGRVIGVARSRKLSVEEGGQLSGRMEMLSSDGTVTPAPTAPTPALAAPSPAPAEA